MISLWTGDKDDNRFFLMGVIRMNWLDLIIIIALLVAAVAGFMQGFVSTLFSLIGTAIGIIVAANFYTQLASLLKFISKPDIANIIAFALILIVIFIISVLIGSALKALLATIHLGCADKIAGGILGVIVGALIIGAILAIFVKIYGEGPVTDSLIAGILLNKFPILLGLLPGKFKVIQDFFQ
jgi:membrane protein required for colicin V production